MREWETDAETEHCPKMSDGTHCEHWWDGEACCACGAPAMSPEAWAELNRLNGEDA